MYSNEPTEYLKQWAHDYESMIKHLETKKKKVEEIMIKIILREHVSSHDRFLLMGYHGEKKQICDRIAVDKQELEEIKKELKKRNEG